MLLGRHQLTRFLGIFAVMVLTAAGATSAEFKVGYVLVATGTGYNVYDSTGAFVETFSDTTSCTVTAACTAGVTLDDTWHPVGTYFVNNVITRFRIGGSHLLLQKLSTNPPSATNDHTESVAFNGRGKFLVAISGPDHVLQRYVYDPTIPGYKLDATFTVVVSSGNKKGPDWIDFADTNGKKLFYTSEDSTIRIADFSTNPPTFSSFLSSSLFTGKGAPFSNKTTFFGLRVLADGSVLVAANTAIYQVNSAGNQVLQTFDAPNENNWQVLSRPDFAGDFYAGNPVSHKFYRFNLASGVPDSTFTAVSTGTDGPNGIETYGSFNPAQAAPTRFSQNVAVSADMTASASFVLQDNTKSPTWTNKLTVTALGVPGTSVTLSSWASVIAPLAGYSDSNLACTKTAGTISSTPPTGTKCVVWQLEDNAGGLTKDVSLVAGTGPLPVTTTNSLTDMNTRLLENEAINITAGVRPVDPFGQSRSLLSLHEVGGLPSSCVYLPPVVEGGSLSPTRNNVTFKIQCTNLPAGDNLNNIFPFISIGQAVTGGAPNLLSPFTPTGGTPTQSECYRLDTSANPPTFVVNWDTGGVTGNIVATTFFGSSVCGGKPPFALSPVDVEFNLTK